MNSSGYVTYKGIELEIDYYSTPYVPERLYLSNGDPGYPAEGGDFDVEGVRLLGSDVELIELFTDEQLSEIGNAFIEQNKD